MNAHGQQAERLVDKADGDTPKWCDSREDARAWQMAVLAEAQVLATLAVADELGEIFRLMNNSGALA